MSIEAFSARRHDEGHFVPVVDRSKISPEVFFQHATDVLHSVHQSVAEEVIPTLDVRPGKWHPAGGFMVYHLGVNEDGESLRLHIWPEGQRISSPVGPHIHNHAWQLSSLVLAGTYTDTIYSVENGAVMIDEGHRAQTRKLRGFRLDYLPDGSDALVTDGTCYDAVPMEQRNIPAGNIHTIKDGLFHLPIIPLNTTVATLVLDTPALGYPTTVLIDSDMRPIQTPRRATTSEESRRASQLLMQ